MCASFPRTTMRPSSGGYMPYRTCISVDFPAPFSPMSAWISPSRKARSTESFATTPGNRLVIPSRDTSGAPERPASCSFGSAVAINLWGVRNRYLSVDDLLLVVLDLRLDVLRKEVLVVVELVHGVVHALFGHSQRDASRLEVVLGHLLDDVEDGRIDPLQ